jgi:hypothetical protein
MQASEADGERLQRNGVSADDGHCVPAPGSQPDVHRGQATDEGPSSLMPPPSRKAVPVAAAQAPAPTAQLGSGAGAAEPMAEETAPVRSREGAPLWPAHAARLHFEAVLKVLRPCVRIQRRKHEPRRCLRHARRPLGPRLRSGSAR